MPIQLYSPAISYVIRKRWRLIGVEFFASDLADSSEELAPSTVAERKDGSFQGRSGHQEQD